MLILSEASIIKSPGSTASEIVIDFSIWSITNSRFRLFQVLSCYFDRLGLFIELKEMFKTIDQDYFQWLKWTYFRTSSAQKICITSVVCIHLRVKVARISAFLSLILITVIVESAPILHVYLKPHWTISSTLSRPESFVRVWWNLCLKILCSSS